ncbi:general vesicular transport factor [Holotrichia oblita]|uniref:General vesicular transport factor n=1 Tax=Holotrichia oblita TaxID=644536 RepID=A0ACB9SR00_HOLOL|nr:general vesicular transport factor [Holotrichia oblita]
MEYFKSGLKSVLGTPQPGAQPTEAETIECLVNRVETSTLLKDRRDACRALRASSKKYRLEVGARGMNALCQILELDRTDGEIISYCLDTLCNITSKEVFEEENKYSAPKNVNLGEQFTEMFLKNPENVTLVLGFLEEYDFKVRWPAVKLLTSLLSRVPADILSETMNTVAEMIRGNLTNQEYFANVMAPSDPPQPAIVVLLNSMVNEKQPFNLRCAASYCFHCFLYKNEISQAQVVQTLLPTSSGGSIGLTTGQLLCSGLFSTDSLSIWFSAVALSHTLIENPAQKEQLLRVFIATNVGVQPVSLLHQCATYFQQTSKLQAKLGILMLLSMWLSYCPPAVQVFLNVPGAMAFLTAQTSANEYDNNEELLQGLCAFIMGLCVVFNDNTVQNYNKENLSQLIEKRVGVETYLGKLGEISRHEVYSKAAKQPQVRVKHSTELLLEYEFCKLFKVLENVIINALGVQRELSNGNMTELSLSEHENALLLQYKDVIRDQDRRLSDIQRQLELMGHEKQQLSNQLEELQQTNLQLQDQNTLLKAQLSTGATIVNNLPTTPNKNVPIEQEYNDQNDLADKLKCLEMEGREKQSEIDSLKKEQDDLLELLTEQELKLNTFKNRLIELGETIEDDPESDNISVGSDN